MKLTETIDKCIELVSDEISLIEYYISEAEHKNVPNTIKSWKKESEELKDHLSNLVFIKYETGLQEIEEIN